MGTSLSGLTPATTFDGLLKTGDNDPIGSGLKTISDGSGNDSVLQLSYSELKINGGQATIVGAGNDNTTTAFLVQNSDGDELLDIDDNGTVTLGRSNGKIVASPGGLVSVPAYAFSHTGSGLATFDNGGVKIIGSGASAGTTSLLVQNSAGTQALKVTDDGITSFGTNSNINATNNKLTIYNIDDSYLKVNSNAGFGTNFTATERVKIQGIGNDNTTTSLLVQNSDGNTLLKADDGNNVYAINNKYQLLDSKFVSLGNNNFFGTSVGTAKVQIKGSGATSATTALLVQNSAGTRIMEAQDGGNIFFGASTSNYLQNGYNWFGNYNAIGSWNIGTASAMGARVGIKGSGNDNTTTALLVQNSAGTELFKVDDSGATDITANITNAVLGSFRNTDANGFGIELRAGNATSRYSMQWERYSGGGGGRLYPDGVMIGDQVAPTARLQVKGSGASAGTTALLVQNSAGTEHLKVTDDGEVNVRDVLFVNHATVSSRALRLDWGSIYGMDNASELSIGAVLAQAATAPRILLGGKTRASGADAIQVQTLNGMYIATTAFSEDPSAQLHIKGSGNDATTTALLVQNSDGTTMFSVKDSGFVDINPTNNSGGSFKVRGDSIDSLLFVNANDNYVGIGGTTSSSSIRAYVKGKGADSNTTALLVENSAGTDLLKVTDDGIVEINQVLKTPNAFKLNLSSSDRFTFSLYDLYPQQSQNLGQSGSATRHWENIYSKGITHITDNTTSSTTLDASAKLQVDSTTQGFLPPRMTTEQKTAITSPAAGLMVYDTDQNQMNYYNGSNWVAF